MNTKLARQSRRRCGYSLMELMVSIGVLMIAMDISVQLGRSVIRAGANNRTMNDQSSRIDAAVATLRGDVWGASRIDVVDSRTVRLSRGGALAATWTIAADDSVQRTDASGQVRQWPGIGKNWTFARDGAALTISDGVSQGATAMRCVSQVLLAGGAR